MSFRHYIVSFPRVTELIRSAIRLTRKHFILLKKKNAPRIISTFLVITTARVKTVNVCFTTSETKWCVVQWLLGKRRKKEDKKKCDAL